MNKSVVIKSEVMQVVVSKVSVLADKDNKVRFNIGMKNIGDGLASAVCIVNGGAMTAVGFKTELPKGEFVIPEGGSYMSFIVKASDFVERAGALLSLKADITIVDSEASVILTCKDGVKIPISKVSAESAEPLLTQDYDDYLCDVSAGKEIIEALNYGGYHALSAEERFASVILSFDKGIASVFSVSNIGGGTFRCPVQMQSKATSSNNSNSEKTVSTAEQAGAVVHFLKEYINTLSPDKKGEVYTTMSSLVSSPDELLKFAVSCGYVFEIKKEETVVNDNNEPVFAALSAANYQMITKLFTGIDNIHLRVTPKNLHINGSCIKATFALTEVNKSIINLFGDFAKTPYENKFVVDRDDFLAALNLMKLGDSNIPTVYKGLKSSFSFEKEGITSRVSIVASEGEMSKVKGAFNSVKISNVLSHLKAGNVLIKFANAKSPLCFSNGDLTEENITGSHFIIGVRMDEKKEEPDEPSDKDNAIEVAQA